MLLMRSIYRFTPLCTKPVSGYEPISAQDQMKGWEFGPWAGVSYYFGDLNTNYRLDRPNLAGGFAARYNFNPRLAFPPLRLTTAPSKPTIAIRKTLSR